MAEIKETKKIEVKLLGKSYLLATEDEEAHIQAVANYVNTKLERLAKEYPHLGLFKIGLLAALHITDEYFKLQKSLEERISFLLEKLEAA
jgi:cell division protein ZapA